MYFYFGLHSCFWPLTHSPTYHRSLVYQRYSDCYTRSTRTKSDVQLNLRAKESQRALIDAAAETLHKSRTDFILKMAC